MGRFPRVLDMKLSPLEQASFVSNTLQVKAERGTVRSSCDPRDGDSRQASIKNKKHIEKNMVIPHIAASCNCPSTPS